MQQNQGIAAGIPAKERGGCAKEFGIGCLFDVLIFGVATALLTEERMVSSLAYLMMLAVPALALRWVLARKGLLYGWPAKLFGSAIVILTLILATIKPITIEDPNGQEVVATPHTLAEKTADAIVDTVAGDKEDGGKGGGKDGKGEKVDWSEVPPGVKFTPAPTNSTETVEEALAELNSLIGLKEVKDEVNKFTKLVKIARQREEAGLKVAPVSYHMVFTGNPGTGKTTVARIMAKIYRALGIVKRGHLVETDRGGLIAEYVGQTAVKTGKVIDFALDGVLFIDEAYAITEGDGKQGYGSECIATLLKRMEDERDRLVVIVAGYTDEMRRFIDANPGLQSRFNRYIHFPDYTAAELADIFRLNARKSEYVLAPDVDANLEAIMGALTRKRDRKFGNGRFVRNMFEKAVERQAMRVAELENPTREQLMTLTRSDLGL